MTHGIKDQDLHFLIDPITRSITNQTTAKVMLMQFDHNSERFTFELPGRSVEGHDMSLCDKVEVHYINVSGDKQSLHADVYKVTDLEVNPDSGVCTFSWTISAAATQYAGALSFLVRFSCHKDGKLSYAWSTAVFSGISISQGMNNGEEVLTDYSDVLAEWEARIIALQAEVADLKERGGVELAQSLSGNEEDKAPSVKAVNAGFAGKVDKVNKAGVNVYTTTDGGSLPVSATNRKGYVATWGGDTSGETGGDGYMSTADPINPYHAVPKKWAEEHFVPIYTDYPSKIYGTGGSAGNATQRIYSMSPIGYTTGDILNFLTATSTSFDNKEPTCTIGVCDPIKPIQVANMRYVDRKCRDLQQGVYNALGAQYVTVEDTSTSDFSQIPEGAMPFAYFESLGDIVVYGHDGDVIANTAEVTGIYLLGEGGNQTDIDMNSLPTFFEIPNGFTTIMLSLSIPEASEMSYFEIKGKKIIYQVKVGA